MADNNYLKKALQCIGRQYRNESRQNYLLDFPPELQQISIAIPNRKFAHAEVEIFDGVFYRRFIFQLFPDGIYVINIKINCACQHWRFEF